MLKYHENGGINVIIQAHSKGLINCELGIIESLSIRRAGNGLDGQTINNVPTEIEVSITIKDLYPSLSITNMDATHGWAMLTNNIGLLDFVASFSGYNLNNPDIIRQVKFYFDYVMNRYFNIPQHLRNIGRSIQDRTRDASINLTTLIRN